MQARFVLRLKISVGACCFVALVVLNGQTQTRAQDSAVSSTTPESQIRVIPQPRQVDQRGNRFVLDKNVRLIREDAHSDEDAFAAQDLKDDLKETFGYTLNLGKGRARRVIRIGALNSPVIEAAFKRLGMTAPPELTDEGYLLSVDESEIVIGGRSAAGVFYGIQTLKQLVNQTGQADQAVTFVPGVRIIDWPVMRWRAVSDDISRGPVPKVDYIKRQIRTMAMFKLNMHSFYMEHTFATDKHPLIGHDGGAITPAEIPDLVSYAKQYHVELVPEQQTFGHLHKVLRLEKYAPLAETPYGDVLSPQQPASYKLVADIYSELNTLFPGQFFHIGSDETFELGQGQSQEEVKQKGLGAVYFEHLNRVRDILKPYNRRLMFWGDIALNHPDLLKDVPKDMIVMNWQYGARDNYNRFITPFKSAGLEQFVCPGVQNWNQIFPNIDAAVVNIPNFVRDGQAAGAIGMMNTSWDDDGESLFDMTWYGVVLGAAAAWQPGQLDLQRFDDNFDWDFFGVEGHQFVKAIHTLGHIPSFMNIGTTDSAFWQEPFTSAFQKRARDLMEKTKEMRLQVETAEETILRDGHLGRRNQSMLKAMQFAARRFDFLGRRMEVMEAFSREYWTAYLNLGNRQQVGRLRRYSGEIYNGMRELAEELSLLREEYRQLWLAENRPYWLDSVLARYDSAIQGYLTKTKAMQEALRRYDEGSILPNPEEFGLGPRPPVPAPAR